MITEIVAHLGANKGTLGLAVIGNAAEFQSAAEANPTAFPAAYVVPLEEVPGENPLSGAVIQRTRISVGICFCVRNVADPKGGAANHDMTTLRGNVKALLLGWQPLEGYDPLERGRCALLSFKAGGVMWWQDTYTSSYFDRSEL